MRFSRVALVGLLVAGAAACNSDEVTTVSRPPLAGVRFINALPDTGAVDIRMVEGDIEYKAHADSITFRVGTEHQPTLAGVSQRIRVFPTSRNAAVTSQFLIDTTFTFEANRNYTMLVVGSARANTDRFLVLVDSAPTPDTLSIAVRTVNAGAATGIDSYNTATATTAISGTPAAAGVAPLATSGWVTRPRGQFAVRATRAGTPATIVASEAAPAGTPSTGPLVNPIAGATVGGTAMSAFVFPASVTGSRAPQTAAFLAPGIIFFMDRIPTTVPLTQ